MDWKSRRITTLLAAMCLAMVCPAVFSQGNPTPGGAQAAVSGTATPQFDVATIKPHPGMLTMTGVMNAPDGINGSAATLAMLVQYAYDLRSEDQVSGGPDWTKTDRFDVQAKLGEVDIAALDKLSATDKKARLRLMTQALLADRFQLRVHSQTKQVPIYELVVAKGGPKLTDAATDTDGQLQLGKDGKPLHGFIRFLNDTSVAQGYSMPWLADFLSQPTAGLGRTVVDRTKLPGTYNFTLDWTPPHPGVRLGAADGSSPPGDPPSLFTALGDLGLKLQPSTGPLQTVVIDHVERPTAN